MKEQQNFRLDTNIVQALREHVEDEHRTVTQVVELALMEYLSARGVKIHNVTLPGVVRTKTRGAK